MSYHHITITERCCIYQFLNSGMSIRAIAKALHRSPSTISKEIARNTSQDAETSTYCPSKANSKYLDRRKECHRKSSFTSFLPLHMVTTAYAPDFPFCHCLLRKRVVARFHPRQRGVIACANDLL